MEYSVCRCESVFGLASALEFVEFHSHLNAQVSNAFNFGERKQGKNRNTFVAEKFPN